MSETFAEAAESAKSGVAGAFTVKVIGVVAVKVPLAPVIITVAEVKVAVLDALNVTVLLPVVEAGLKEAVTPAGSPLALKATLLLNPPVGSTVIMLLAVAPCVTDTLAGLAERVNPGATDGFTVRLTDVVWVRLPLVPVTVTLDVPVAAVADAVKVSVLLPVVDAGLKLAVTPVGKPLAARATLPVNPPKGVTVTVLVPVPPCVTVALAAAREKSGFCAWFTVKWIWIVWLMFPLVPVMLMVAIPSEAELVAVKVSVLVVVADAGLKVAVTPPGTPLALKATLPLKIPIGVMVTVVDPEPPCVMVGEPADKEKSSNGVCTVRLIEVVWVRLPLVPVIVT